MNHNVDYHQNQRLQTIIKNIFSSNKGFTLVETTVSIAIMAIMATMVVGIFASASMKTAGNMRANEQREAVLAQIETAIANGIIAPELERDEGSIIIDFNGNKINAVGVYLTGEYGDEKIPAKYFYSAK